MVRYQCSYLRANGCNVVCRMMCFASMEKNMFHQNDPPLSVGTQLHPRALLFVF